MRPFLYRFLNIKLFTKERLIWSLRDRDALIESLASLRENGWLRDGSLRWRQFNGVDWHFADLSGADMRYIRLNFANLWDSNLQKTDLRYARLAYADLEQADLRGADLRYAILYKASLNRTILPDGRIYGPKIDMDYYTEPTSPYYGEPPARSSNFWRK